MMTTHKATPESRLLGEFRDRLAGARLDLARTVATTDADLETLAAHESREIAEDPATGTVGDLLSRLEGRERRQLDEIRRGLKPGASESASDAESPFR
jgi:hypothetical protein